MYKKYIVRLSDEERRTCQELIKKLKGSSQKARRAQILLKADADGPGWPDAKIAEAFDCRVQTIENLRKRLVTESFELALDGKKRPSPPTPPKLDGEGEAKLIAMRLGKPPAGYGHWTLQLLADEFIDSTKGLPSTSLSMSLRGQRALGKWAILLASRHNGNMPQNTACQCLIAQFGKACFERRNIRVSHLCGS